MIFTGLISYQEAESDIDLRNRPCGKVIKRARNQNGFCVCWAFAIISVMECAVAKIRGDLDTELSIQEVIDSLWSISVLYHSTPEVVDDYGGYGMDISDVFKWMMQHGVVAEENYRFVGKTQVYVKRPPVRLSLFAIFKINKIKYIYWMIVH